MSRVKPRHSLTPNFLCNQTALHCVYVKTLPFYVYCSSQMNHYKHVLYRECGFLSALILSQWQQVLQSSHIYISGPKGPQSIWCTLRAIFNYAH